MSETIKRIRDVRRTVEIYTSCLDRANGHQDVLSPNVLLVYNVNEDLAKMVLCLKTIMTLDQ